MWQSSETSIFNRISENYEGNFEQNFGEFQSNRFAILLASKGRLSLNFSAPNTVKYSTQGRRKVSNFWEARIMSVLIFA